MSIFSNVDGLFENGSCAGLEFEWQGTQLGVRREGTEEYEYQDLRGETGATGNGWLFGMNEPLVSYGKDGDLYLRTTTYDIYKKKVGAWEHTGNIKGATGEAGQDGTNYLTQEQANKVIIGVSISEDKNTLTFSHVDGSQTQISLV